MPQADQISKKKKKGFVDGAVAGGTKLLLTMPLDTIKVTMQINRHGDLRYRSMWSTTQAIILVGGPKGLYAGLTASLLNQCGKVIRMIEIFIIRFPVSYGIDSLGAGGI